MTESEYLDRQEARARGALAESARRIESELSRAVPVERMVRDHPVLSLGAGAAGGVATGFLLGKLLGPRSAAAVVGALQALAWPAVRRYCNAAVDAVFASARPDDGADTDDARD